jgi:hypothetical protein
MVQGGQHSTSAFFLHEAVTSEGSNAFEPSLLHSVKMCLGLLGLLQKLHRRHNRCCTAVSRPQMDSFRSG